MASDPHAADPGVVVDFLKNTLPFSDLPDEELQGLAKHCIIDFMPKGVRFLVQNETQVDSLFLIQSGGVRLFLRDEEERETLIDYRGEGGSVGAPALIRDSPANLDAETVEDTFVFKLAKDAFMHLVQANPMISQYYLKALSENYLSKAFAELRARPNCLPSEGSLPLFSTRVADMVVRPPVRFSMGHTIQEAAMRMEREGVGSLLIDDPSEEVVGIVTDKDLRKAVSLGMDYSAPIETIMSTPVATMESDRSSFDAVLEMMRRQIHHMMIVREGELQGVITSHDVISLQGASPVALFREISSQRAITGLYPLAARIPRVVRALVEEGAKAGHITRMISVLNDMILEKMLTLLLKEMGRPPSDFCWLLLGSEGRREQTFKTDQDNALVFRAFEDEILIRASQIYFEAFTQKAIEHLVQCGFPLCPGGFMASNEKWRQPFPVWRDYFEHWIMVPEPEEVMKAAIFFDFRSGFGDATFVEELRRHVNRHARRQEVFLRHLAGNCLQTKPPLSFFRNFIVEKNGEHKNTLDLKARGLVAVVDFARVMSLQHGIRETNTLGRLERIRESGHAPTELCNDLAEAYEFMMQLRLVHQLEQVEAGYDPDNRIDPAALSDLDKRTLKEAFAIIGRMQSFLKDTFKLNL